MQAVCFFVGKLLLINFHGWLVDSLTVVQIRVPGGGEQGGEL
jgi:hypothetical protein